jgi:hypothetical protein
LNCESAVSSRSEDLPPITPSHRNSPQLRDLHIALLVVETIACRRFIRGKPAVPGKLHGISSFRRNARDLPGASSSGRETDGLVVPGNHRCYVVAWITCPPPLCAVVQIYDVDLEPSLLVGIENKSLAVGKPARASALGWSPTRREGVVPGKWCLRTNG